MEIKLKTLTPIWTGGVETGKMDRIHETSILGSLRWWYEAIVRGMGGKVCDPTSNESCNLSGKILKQYKQLIKNGKEWRIALREVGICESCQIFGTTGWQRRFRLKIHQTDIHNKTVQHPMKASRSYTKNSKMIKPMWFFQNPAKEGIFCIEIQSIFNDFQPKIISGLLQFISDWVAIGARNQMGFGVIFQENQRADTKPFSDWLSDISGKFKYSDFPALNDMFFAQIQMLNASDQDTFNLKYDLRQCFGNAENTNLRHFIMGTIKGERIASKVKMS